MAVNGGSGNQIKFSELQSYYGGQGEIHLSDYYRGGAFVGVNLVNAQSNISGTSSSNVGQFRTTVSGGYTGSVYTPSNVGGSAYTVTAADYDVNIYGVTFDADGGRGTVTVRWRVNNGPEQSGQFEDSTGNGGGGIVFSYRGPTNSNPNINVGDTVRITYYSARSGTVGPTRRAEQYTVTFRNNSSVTITTSSSSTGGAQSYSAGQTRTVKNNTSTPNWTLGYPAIPGNTNIPGSGQITLNHFNAPGSPAP